MRSGLLIDNIGVDELERLGLDRNVLDFVKSVSVFFQNYPVVPIAKKAGSVLFFPASEVEVIPPVFEQASGAQKAVQTFDKRALKFVYKYPILAPYVLAKAPMNDMLHMMRGKRMGKMMGAVLLAGNWCLFRMWCLENTIPVESTSNLRKKLETVTSAIGNSRRLTDLTAMGTVKFSFAHGIDEMVSGTAFAVAPSEIYAGTDLGLVLISFDAEGFPVLRTLLECGVTGLYSLCYVLGYVYVIGESVVERIHPRSGERKRMTPVKGLRFPTITDGRYFYSIDVSDERKVHVAKFCLKDGAFSKVSTIDLEGQLPTYDKRKCCFATDGAVISILPWGSPYQMYSLITGRHLKMVPCLRPIRGWSIQPYTLDQCIVTMTDFTVIQNSIHTPRWLEGYTLAPMHKGEDAILYEAHLAVYHGANLFSEYQNVTSVFNHFLVRKNAPGIYMMGHICVEMSEDLSPCLAYMMDRWKTDASLRRFLLYVYLAWLSRSNVAASQNNIANLYLEQEKDLEIIWSFHEIFNFKRFYLSDLATSNLLKYVIENWDRFPALSGEIILAFCTHKVRHCMVPDLCEQMVPHFKAIMEHIRVNLRLVLDGLMEERWFRDSTQLGILQYLLVLIRKYQEVWYIIGIDFLKMLDFAFYKRRSDMPEIEKTLDYAMTLFFEILRTVPRQNETITFPSFFKFAEAHPHPLNGVRRDLEDRLLSLLNMSHDIHSEAQFAEILFKCRRYLLFEDPASLKLLDKLAERFAAEKILDYLRCGDIRVVETIRDPNIMEWVVSVFRENAHSLTTKQKYILTLYIELLTDNLVALTMKGNSGMSQLLTTSNILFLINPKVMMQTNLTIKASNVMRMDVRELRNSQKNIIALFQRIENGNQFLDAFLGAEEADFLEKSGEQKVYKSVLLSMIAVKGGLKIDPIQIERSSLLHIRYGSEDVVQLVLKMVCHLEESAVVFEKLYPSLVDLVACYFQDGVNPFVCQDDELVIQKSIFTLISYLKKMFNMNMGFTKFFNEFIEHVKTERETVVVFVILNNTFEVVRRGVELHYVDTTMTEVIGKCVKFDPTEGVVVLTTGWKGKLGACVISESKNIWCACRVTVNLALVKNLRCCYGLFTKITIENNINRAFMLASFLEFCRLQAFRSLITAEHIKEIASTDLTLAQSIEARYFDFLHFAALSRLQMSVFSFSDDKQRGTLRTSHSDEKLDGILVTLAQDQVFTSSPIHPDASMSLKFTVTRGSSARIRLCAVSKVWNTSLSGFDIQVNTSTTDSFVEIEFNSSSCLITASLNGSLLSQLKNCAGVTFYWVELEVAKRSIVKYQVAYDPVWRRRGQRFTHGKGLEIPSVRTPIPGSDSSLFNQFALSDATDVVTSALSSLIYAEVMADHTKLITNDRLFVLMSMVHYYPFDEQLVMNHMNLAKLWCNYEEKIHMIIMNELLPERLQDMINELQKQVSAADASLAPKSHTTLHLETDQFVICSNTFVMNETSESPMNLIGFNNTPIKVECPVCLIPLDDCNHSIISYALDLLHVLMASVTLKSVDAAKLTSIANLLVKRYPMLTSMVKHILDLISVVAPESVSVHDFSFLVNFSQVYANPERYLLPCLKGTEFENHANEIAAQLQNWHPCHSHQIFCSAALQLTKPIYSGLPLSSEFSYETVRFVCNILSQPADTELFIITRHFLAAEHALKKKPSLSRTDALFSFSSVSEQNDELEPSSEFSFYRKLAHTASLNALRISFLRSRSGPNLFTMVDPDKVRIEYQQDKIGRYVEQVKEDIAAGMFLKSQQDCQEMKWLKNVVLSLDSFVFLQFQEWATGRWGTLAMENGYSNICVFFSDAPEHVGQMSSYRPECLIIVGKYQDENSLKQTLLQNIQRYQDENNVSK